MSNSNNLILDTNAAIAILNGTLAAINFPSSSKLHVPVIVLGELLAGARRSNRIEDNLRRIIDLTNLLIVLPCDLTTAEAYGEIESSLRRKGRPIPDNDAWIAAITLQYDMTLITPDAHFANIDNLHTLSW